MSVNGQENPSSISLADSYWREIDRHREAMELVPIEELQRRRECVQDHQTRLSLIVDQLLEQSRESSPEGWFTLGKAYQIGNGAQRNRREALRWLRRAAEAGHIKAMVSLALAMRQPDYENDQIGAVAWLRKAAELGSASGMAFLGFAYREGTGVPQDPRESVSWFIKAVEAGDSHSMVHAGRMYARYFASPTEALKWFLRAAEVGHKDSFVELAILYDQRDTPVYDPAEAVKWYKAVLETSAGSRPRAMLALSRHCRDGTGTTQDIEMAREWLRQLLQILPEKSSDRREATELLKRMEGELL